MIESQKILRISLLIGLSTLSLLISCTSQGDRTQSIMMSPKAERSQPSQVERRTPSIAAASIAGATCRVIETDKNEKLISGYFDDDGVGTIVTEPGAVLRTSDSGKTWTKRSKSLDKNQSVVSAFVQSNDLAWIIVHEIQSNADIVPSSIKSSQIYATEDGGMTWKLQLSVEGVELSAVHFHDRQNGWAVGGKTIGKKNYAAGAVVFRTKDGGNTWINRSEIADELKTYRVENVISPEADSALLLVSGSKVVKVHSDLLNASTILDLEIPAEFFIGRFRSDAERIWLAGGTQSKEGFGGKLVLHSPDWTHEYDLPFYVNDLYVDDQRRIFLAGHKRTKNLPNGNDFSSSGPLLMVSLDDGLSLHQICKDVKIPEIRAFIGKTQDGMWAVGGSSVIKISGF